MVLSIGSHLSDKADIETLCIARSATADTRTVAAAAAVVAVHTVVLVVMVSPFEDTRGFPWFMTMDSTTRYVDYVEHKSAVTQCRDPRQQVPPPLVILPPVDVLDDVLVLVPPTMVLPDDQAQHRIL